MEKSSGSNDASKGLNTQTVALLRDRLGRAYSQEFPEFTCHYSTDLKIGWIINEGNVLVYNNENVYFELKLPPKLYKIKASQIIIVNTESGAFILIVDGTYVHSRVINEEYDVRFIKTELTQLNNEEKVSVVHLLNSPISNVPALIIVTTEGRLINAQLYVDEETLNLSEVVLEPPKRILSSLTSFFSGGNIEDTNVHNIYSDTSSKDQAYLYVCADKTINVWTLSNEGSNLWQINVENAFRRHEQSVGEVQRFRIVGEEIIDKTHEDDMIINLVVQIITRKGVGNTYYSLYYLFRISVNSQTQRYTDFEPGQLTEAKPYTQEEDKVKCLVCTNQGTMTYTFLCYETTTLCINVFSDHIEEEELTVRVIGSGIMKENVKYFLLYIDKEIIMFSLLREQNFGALKKLYLEDVEKNCRMRKKIKDANMENMASRVQSDDERKVLDMIRSVHDTEEGIHSQRTDLLSMMKSYSEDTFREILMNVTRMLIDDPIRDSMVCNNQREEIQQENKLDYISDNPTMIDWSLNTKLSRVNVIKSFLEQAGIDFIDSLRRVEENLVFFQAIKRNHDMLCKQQNNYQSLIIFNQTIQEIVKNIHKVSKEEIKQKGTTSSLVFYSFPLKGADHFILTLCKLMYEKKYTENLKEDTVLQLSHLVLDTLKSVQEYREGENVKIGKPATELFWTMSLQNFIDPIKRVIDLMPDLIRINESAELNERMYDLARIVLRELHLAQDLENIISNEEEMRQNFIFIRNKYICTLEEFTPLYAVDLAIEFIDVVNTTRLSISLNNYSHLYKLLKELKGEEKQAAIEESMQWLVDDYQDRLRRNKSETFTFKLQLFDIYEEKFDIELAKFLNQYPKLKLVYYMRKGKFEAIQSECEDLGAKTHEPKLKSLLKSIHEVNKVDNVVS